MLLILNSPGVACQGPGDLYQLPVLYRDIDSLFTEVTPCLLSPLSTTHITLEVDSEPGMRGHLCPASQSPRALLRDEKQPPRQTESCLCPWLHIDRPGKPCPPACSSTGAPASAFSFCSPLPNFQLIFLLAFWGKQILWGQKASVQMSFPSLL